MVYNNDMKIFTVQNLVILIIMVVISIAILITMFVSHSNMIKKIKNLEAKNVFMSNTQSYVVNYPDTRERVYHSDSPMEFHIDRLNAMNSGKTDEYGLNLRTFIPKEKNFKAKRVWRVILIIVFTISVLVVVLSSILLLGDYFNQDIVKILHMEYSRTFWEYIKSYDLLFGSFFVSMICFTGIRMISDTIINYKRMEQTYIKVYNMREYQKTFAPVYINIE